MGTQRFSSRSRQLQPVFIREIEHGFQSSLTSREILRRAQLPGEAKTAFGGLVAAVEITLFGQQVANLATYQLCRENSRRVLTAAA